MDVRDAIATRYSCRAFLPTPVPLLIVREILNRAARAPSGAGGRLFPAHSAAAQAPPLRRASPRPSGFVTGNETIAAYEAYECYCETAISGSVAPPATR